MIVSSYTTRGVLVHIAHDRDCVSLAARLLTEWSGEAVGHAMRETRRARPTRSSSRRSQAPHRSLCSFTLLDPSRTAPREHRSYHVYLPSPASSCSP
jgi:hypothetical protein